jgi:hypothetical protein
MTSGSDSAAAVQRTGSNAAPAPQAIASAAGAAASDPGMLALVRTLVRPYRAWVLIVFTATMVETLMSLASPWPLKIVLDNALGHDKLPEWLLRVHDLAIDRDTMDLALFAGLATVVIAAIGALAQ